MTQNRLKYIILMLRTMFIVGNFYGHVKPLQADPDSDKSLQCNESKSNSKYKISCGLNSRALVEYNFDIRNNNDYENLGNLNAQINCYNETPLKISVPKLNINLSKRADTVQFNSCRFSAKDDILKIIKHSLHLSEIETVEFVNELIDSSLSRAHLKPLDGIVSGLSFKIDNMSTVPMDLFDDIKNLEALSIYSNSINSSYLSSLIAPLENLRSMLLEINDLQEPSGIIFAHTKHLSSLEIRNSTVLPSGFLPHISNLNRIHLRGNYLSSLPNDLFVETKALESFSLTDNKVTLKQLPKGLLRDLPFLRIVKIIGCGLEYIPADIFNGLKFIGIISISGNNLQELPLRLFADQEYLHELDLSRNMIRTLMDGLFHPSTHVYRLNLSDNLLTNLSKNTFKYFSNLMSLNLENNNLLTLNSDYNQPQLGCIFDNLPYLDHLNLKNNSIYEFNYNSIMKNKYLSTIDLSYNNISSIRCNFMTYFYVVINFTGNPIYCGFNLVCIHEYIIRSRMEDIPWIGTIRCEFPNALNGRLLYDLKLDELLTSNDISQGNISKRCTYNMRKADLVLVMNCSNGNLTDIPMIPMPDAEQTLSNGIELFMDDNPLTELSTKELKNNANISLISILNISITELPKGFLSKLPILKTVFLVLPLGDIDEDIFFESNAIETLQISGTNIQSLPEQIFANQSKLIHLDLSRNRLKEFNMPRTSLKALEILRLSYNFIEYINMEFPGVFRKLKKLFLDNNRLKRFDMISMHPNLELLSLENNELTDIGSIWGTPGALQLLLKNNSIEDASLLGSEFTPAYIDLSLNKINYINLDFIGSTSFSKTVWNFTDNDIRTFDVSYENSIFDCECETNSFVKEGSPKNMYESLRCLSPNNFIDRDISYLPSEELLCPVESSCPARCVCWFRPSNSTLIVNCSNFGLTKAPSLLELEEIFQNGIELLIEHNQLRSLKPHSQPGYKGITKIFAAYNNITTISSEDIPQNISFLDISYNQLERIDDKELKVFEERRHLRSILLNHNPIICDCSSSTQNLNRFILSNKRLFPGTTECDDGRNLGTLSFPDLCLKEQSNTDKLIWISLSLILCVPLVVTILYLKNKERILIWLYAHNISMCCATEEELDKDKKYDAFISYSSLDADFVALNLVSKLESGPKPYKLCLHERDWLGGGYIPHQIEKSVDRSRRTLIVMSQNYINSRWTRMEFRTAHNASMNEKRPRVIVVMIDDKVDLKDLDSDLRKYIKMYTYLRWGDAWFWDRLKYALPHPSKKNQKNIVKMSELRDVDPGTGYSSDENELF